MTVTNNDSISSSSHLYLFCCLEMQIDLTAIHFTGVRARSFESNKFRRSVHYAMQCCAALCFSVALFNRTITSKNDRCFTVTELRSHDNFCPSVSFTCAIQSRCSAHTYELQPRSDQHRFNSMIGKMIVKRGRKKNNKENHQTTHKVALNWPSFFFFLIRSPFVGEIERT